MVFYLRRRAGRLNERQSGTAFLQMLAAATILSLVAIVPASRLSDRIGRKPVIYGCTALGALGLGIIALAPDVNVATIGAAIFGASQGTFLVGRLGADDRHHPEGRVGAVHGPVERRHGVVDHDRGRDRRDDDGPAVNRSLGVGVGNRDLSSSGSSTSCSARWHFVRSWSPIPRSRDARGRGYARSPRNSLTRRSTARGDRNDSSCHDDGRSQRNGSGWR